MNEFYVLMHNKSKQTVLVDYYLTIDNSEREIKQKEKLTISVSIVAEVE